MSDPRITNVGDTAFNVEFGSAIDRATNARVMALHDAILAARKAGGVAGLVETVPTFRSLLVSYDPIQVRRAEMESAIRDLLDHCGERDVAEPRKWRVPVCYEGDFAPDLDDICAAAGLSRETVIELHSGAEYFVYMLGFMPGFSYMGGVPEPLRLPRRHHPRVKVPAGSVAIAAELAAIYPFDSPGGWHLVGRTPLAFFDKERDPPVLVQPGDHVTFYPIGAEEFAARQTHGQ